MLGWDNILDRMTADVRDFFGQQVAYTRGDVTVHLSAILDLDAKTAPVSPHYLDTEGVQPRLDVRVADLGSLGRPMHGDLVTSNGQTWAVSRVEDGAQGCVSCWLLEPEEVDE